MLDVLEWAKVGCQTTGGGEAVSIRPLSQAPCICMLMRILFCLCGFQYQETSSCTSCCCWPCAPAQANDDKAREIGAAAQAFALKYLSKRARTCYWFHLIKQFSQLLKYK
jgi:hypothetical protein